MKRSSILINVVIVLSIISSLISYYEYQKILSMERKIESMERKYIELLKNSSRLDSVLLEKYDELPAEVKFPLE